MFSLFSNKQNPKKEIEDAGWNTVTGTFEPREPNKNEMWGNHQHWFSRQAKWDRDANGDLTGRRSQ